MTYLISIAIGPVQPFIEAARRTADLCAGSQLLVEIAKAVARVLHDSGGTLIFPADPAKDGPNKVLVTVDGDPSAAVERAQRAAQGVLKQAWHDTLAALGGIPINVERAAHQIDTFLEFYAGWVPLNGSYADARKQVERVLAGRKALREFRRPVSEDGVPKSPLDPSRDTVLTSEKQPAGPPLYRKPAEHLDAVSLIKRLRGRSMGSVKSTTQLAATALIKQLRSSHPAEVNRLEKIAEQAGSGVSVEDLLYPGRRQDAVKAGEITEEQAAEAGKLAEKALGAREPPDWASYYAILVADGDRMGKVLDAVAAGGPDAHTGVSRALSEFAERADEIVGAHEGTLVYSGGDDVLVFLPTHRALECAEALATGFAARLCPVLGKSPQELGGEKSGTLSVGIAIVHHMEPLRISIERARRAEKTAKTQRNALCVALHTRGGEPRITVESWTGFDLRVWNSWILAFRDKDGLSHGVPYELRHLAREARGTIQPETLKAEALRILARKKGGKATEGGKPPYLASLEQAVSNAETPESLEVLVAKLILCRFLAQYPEVEL